MLPHGTLRCLLIPYGTSWCINLPFVTLCMLPHGTLRYFSLPYVTFLYITLPFITLCYFMLHYVIFFRPLVHCVTCCYITLPHRTLRFLVKNRDYWSSYDSYFYYNLDITTLGAKFLRTKIPYFAFVCLDCNLVAMVESVVPFSIKY